MKLVVMTEQWDRACTWVNGRSLRERAMLLLTLVVAIFLFWELMLNQPVDSRRDALAGQRDRLSNTVTQLEQSVDAMHAQLEEAASDTTDDGAVRALRAAIERSDQRLEQRSARLIEPDQMVAVLHRMLEAERELSLERLENVAPERIASDNDVPVYRHRAELVVTGRYLALVEYLRRLENTGWALQWETLEIMELDDSRMRAVVTLSTLSLAEEWIGV